MLMETPFKSKTQGKTLFLLKAKSKPTAPQRKRKIHEAFMPDFKPAQRQTLPADTSKGK